MSETDDKGETVDSQRQMQLGNEIGPNFIFNKGKSIDQIYDLAKYHS